jgi:hypothetical protein
LAHLRLWQAHPMWAHHRRTSDMGGIHAAVVGAGRTPHLCCHQLSLPRRLAGQAPGTNDCVGHAAAPEQLFACD